MALVISLILLAVITFMAVTFLVLSRSEKGAVTTNTDQTLARLAADTGLQRAKTALIAPMLGLTNPFLAGLTVSTNYISPAGYISGNTSVTNVSYHYPNNAALNLLDLEQNLENLYFDPRAPVFIANPTNRNISDFRYYLDLNRNGRYDTNGYSPVINAQGGFYDTNGYPLPFGAPAFNILSNNFVGDPEWIGGLEFPDRRHGPDNRFIYRYAYLVVPSSQVLDLNYIHNYNRLLNPPTMTVGDGFVRNQGVGTWEDNLAGFLVDLNTNLWLIPPPNGLGSPYQYNYANLSLPNYGVAFDDALALLRYRYDGDWRRLQGPTALFLNARQVFAEDDIDTYGAGPVMTGVTLPSDPDITRVSRNTPWAGAYNTNHFFTTQDLFDRTKTARGTPNGTVTFTDRLLAAGTNTASYDRYTYYRLLSQLGTDSGSEQNRINLNYRNMDPQSVIVPGMQTNFYPWDPLQFFTNTANRLLAQAGYTFDVSHIQVYPTNFYTPSVHRIMQLAANIYDATTNNPATAYPYLPTVFRPLLEHVQLPDTNAVFITGFTEVRNANQFLTLPYRDLNNLVDRQAVTTNDMVYGIPLVVGAKKGFPNFNELAMETVVQATRKLEFRRAANGGPVTETNEMYILTVSNTFGVEAWNSYSNAFPRQLEMRVAVEMDASITNELGMVILTNHVFPAFAPTQILPGTWRGFTTPQYASRDGSFRVPFPPGTNHFFFLNTAAYSDATKRFLTLTGRFERNGSQFPVPQWWLGLRTRLRFFLIDTSANRIVDYVNLDNKGETFYVTDMLMRDTPSAEPQCRIYNNGETAQAGAFWCTNRQNNAVDPRIPSIGILNQMRVSQGQVITPAWPFNDTNKLAVDFFRAQFKLGPLYSSGPYSLTNVFYAPFSPTRDIHVFTSWQANDPLVHYMLGDLVSMNQTNRWDFAPTYGTITNIGVINQRYEPWSAQLVSSSTSPFRYDLSMKDPLVSRSDDWNFPTNKFPNIGWLGRVHRGTPWQTVYLKSAAALPANWMRYVNNGLMITNVGQVDTNIVALGHVIDDTAMSRPTNDWPLLDIFTAAVNDNATHGQLSVNQTNLAAWSAVLSGVNVMPDLRSNVYIQPAGLYDPLNPTPVAAIVNGINRTRAVRPDKTFHHLGEIVSVPELTVKSPYLSGNTNYMSDEVYERIPQQVLGLLQCENAPRFVIYSYGQALKPANRSVMQGGNYAGLCTNYQVTAEVATRAVVRIEGAPKNPRVVVENFNVLPPD